MKSGQVRAGPLFSETLTPESGKAKMTKRTKLKRQLVIREKMFRTFPELAIVSYKMSEWHSQRREQGLHNNFAGSDRISPRRRPIACYSMEANGRTVSSQ